VTDSREVAAHLLACCDAVYHRVGRSAPSLTDDAYCVRAYEFARSMGESALELGDYVGERRPSPLRVIDTVLEHAVLADETGAMLLYALAMAVGPRLLVSLRDARELLGIDDDARRMFDGVSATVVREILLVGEVARSRDPIDDPTWQAAARDLTLTLDDAGFAESFGF